MTLPDILVIVGGIVGASATYELAAADVVALHPELWHRRHPPPGIAEPVFPHRPARRPQLYGLISAFPVKID
jgi:hypothetical protein